MNDILQIYMDLKSISPGADDNELWLEAEREWNDFEEDLKSHPWD